jgi:Bifunctional DNA primase/polymerase, N-terminal
MTTPTSASNPRYIDLARDAQRRGLYPTPPINPIEKGPRYSSWPGHSVIATTHPEFGFIERWSDEHPTWNCGVVAQPETPYFNLDSDDLEALHAEWAQFSNGKPFPETLFVYSRTDEQGHRRGHYHFLKTPYSNAKLGNVSNWSLASKNDLTNAFAELQYTSGQCVWAGSIHSKTGKPLVIEADIPMQAVPDLFVDFLASLPRSTRQGRGKVGGGFVALTDGDLEGMTANSGRHDYLNSCAGFYTNGDEDELLETLSEINSKFGEPCEDDYVARLATDFAQLEPATKAVTTYCHSIPATENDRGHMWLFTDEAAYEKCVAENPATVATEDGEAVEFNPWEYALAALPTYDFSGWFPRGRNTLMSGSSGSMKTTFVAQALVAARSKESFLGHTGTGLDFFFLFADRGKYDAEETFMRMRMVGQVPYECVNGVSADATLEVIKRVARDRKYAIIFIDGGDLLVEDNNSGTDVARVTTVLQRIAEHYGVGFLISTGSGKGSAKALKEGAERRSMSKGSEVWGRTCGTVFTINADGDGTDSLRRMVVQHRNAPTEKFLLDVQHGRLVQVDEEAKLESETTTNVLNWIFRRESFTRNQFREAFKQFNGKKLADTLSGLEAASVIAGHKDGRTTVYTVQPAERVNI